MYLYIQYIKTSHTFNRFLFFTNKEVYKLNVLNYFLNLFEFFTLVLFFLQNPPEAQLPRAKHYGAQTYGIQ